METKFKRNVKEDNPEKVKNKRPIKQMDGN